MKRCLWLCCAQQHACDNMAALGHTGEQLPEPALLCPGVCFPLPTLQAGPWQRDPPAELFSQRPARHVAAFPSPVVQEPAAPSLKRMADGSLYTCFGPGPRLLDSPCCWRYRGNSLLVDAKCLIFSSRLQLPLLVVTNIGKL